MLWFVIFAIATPINLASDVSDDSWAAFWLWKTVLIFVLGVVAIVWFFIGGVRDLRDLFRTLETAKRNPLDDGTVVGHHNLGDAPENGKVDAAEKPNPIAPGEEAAAGKPA
jgi:hypothetical protein